MGHDRAYPLLVDLDCFGFSFGLICDWFVPLLADSWLWCSILAGLWLDLSSPTRSWLFISPLVLGVTSLPDFDCLWALKGLGHGLWEALNAGHDLFSGLCLFVLPLGLNSFCVLVCLLFSTYNVSPCSVFCDYFKRLCINLVENHTKILLHWKWGGEFAPRNIDFLHTYALYL